jgi:thiol-disulfide isomerase/thioredoxin
LAALVVAACGKAPETPHAPAAKADVAPAPAAHKAANEAGESGIAWKEAANDSEIDAAFAVAKSENKPVFVYWGAKWCPPCNQVKATLFNRQDFIARSRSFVPVYVDGDSPGAQKIGARFRVSGYPTMVLFNPQGKEVTRLPGEVDAVRYSEVLTLGMNAARPVSAVLADALARPAVLGANDWRLLAFYSWDTDHQQMVAKDKLPAPLLALADACPAAAAESAVRLRLKALVAADAKAPPKVDATTREAALALLADPARAREQTDMLTGYAAEIVRALSAKGSAERAPLLAGFDVALKRLEADRPCRRPIACRAVIAGRPGAHRRRRRQRRHRERQGAGPGRTAPMRSSPTCASRWRAPTARSRRLRAPGGDHRCRLSAQNKPASTASPTTCSRPTSRAATRRTT